MANLTAVILAAGKGTRMKSKLPKVLHKVGGHPMLEHVMDAAEAAGCRDNVVVIGHGAELVRELVGSRARIALQAEQLGTGHAVLQAADTLKDFTGTVMILCGDTPLLEAEELKKFYAEHVKSGAAATVMSAMMEDPFGYGRILRDANGDVAGIVEQKDASEEQKLIKEIKRPGRVLPDGRAGQTAGHGQKGGRRGHSRQRDDHGRKQPPPAGRSGKRHAPPHSGKTHGRRRDRDGSGINLY